MLVFLSQSSSAASCLQEEVRGSMSLSVQHPGFMSEPSKATRKIVSHKYWYYWLATVRTVIFSFSPKQGLVHFKKQFPDTHYLLLKIIFFSF